MSYDPVNALLLFSVAIVLILIIIWPEWGLWHRLKKSMQNNRRIIMEDALKEIYECERNDQEVSIKSLAGSMSVSSDQVAGVIKRLSDLNLITFTDRGFSLTDSGRDYALRIIRIHRLWEQYLAEKTGIPEVAWHNEADKREHESSQDQINEMNHILGYPRYDPHGDPIPTEKGDMPPSEGQALNDYDQKFPAVIIHIEDEPKSIYSEIVNSGISMGMIIEEISENGSQIELEVEGRNIPLSKMAAMNITVRQASAEDKIEKATQNLAMLKVGEQAEVIYISKACRGPQRRRLMDLGILPGTVIRSEMKGIGGDPTSFRIRGAQIALRRDTAKMIHVNKLEKVT
jgi:DtxR family Mn-dependent transcriptional regulator